MRHCLLTIAALMLPLACVRAAHAQFLPAGPADDAHGLAVVAGRCHPGGTVTSQPNVFGGMNYSNGWRSQPNVFGGYNYTSPNGQTVTSQRNVFGGYSYTGPTGRIVTSQPNVFGGMNYSHGWRSQPNVFGGYNYTSPAGRMVTSQPNVFGGATYYRR